MGIAGLCVLFTESEGCSPEKSLSLSQAHRPQITLDLRASSQKNISKHHLIISKHNSLLHAAQLVERNKDECREEARKADCG